MASRLIELLDGRPVVVFGAAFLVTVAAALFLPNRLLLLAMPLAFMAGIGFGRRPVAFLAAGCAFAILFCLPCALHARQLSSFLGSSVDIDGWLLCKQGQTLLLGRMPDGGAVAFALRDAPLEAATGMAVRCTVEPYMLSYNSELLGYSRGLVLQCDARELTVLSDEGRGPLTVMAEQLRLGLADRLRSLSPIRATEVTVSLLYADRSGLPEELRDSFSRSGMSHLTAVSGLHLSLLVGLALWPLRRICRGIAVPAVVGISLSALMCFCTGLSPSVLRAAVMMSLGLCAACLRRRSDPITSLTVSAVAMVAVCPPLLADLSFVLSFCATLGIVLAAPGLRRFFGECAISRLGREPPILRWLFAAIAVSLAAQLACAPVVAAQFDEVPLLGVLSNLLAAPLVYMVLPLGLLASVCSVMGLAGIGAWLLNAANLFSSALALLASVVARIPFASFEAVYGYQMVLLWLFITVAVLAVLPVNRPLRRRCMGGIAALAAALIAWDCYRSATTVAVCSDMGGITVGSGAVAQQIAFEHGDDCYCHLPVGSVIRLSDEVYLHIAAPGQTEIFISGAKLVKYCADYDTIVENGGYVPSDALLLADREGNLWSPGGSVEVARRIDGTSRAAIEKSAEKGRTQ